MAKKVDPIKAKQAKQKKIAIAGGILFVLLLVVEVPKTMKKLHGGSSGADWRTADAAAATTTATPPAGLIAPTLAGGAPTPTTTVSGGPLATEVPPTASVGQLASFGRFASKDPFASQAPTNATATTPPTPPTPPTSGSGSGSVPGGSGGSGAGSGSTPAPAARSSAVLAVNGVQELVSVGADFPAAQPVFHLKSLGAHSAKITIAGGNYADGAQALTLEEGKPVTLMNTADGTRYKLQLYPEGTKAPPAATTGTAPVSTAPVSTTTAPTTTTTTTP